jgi:hypothetical protein
MLSEHIMNFTYLAQPLQKSYLFSIILILAVQLKLTSKKLI